MIEKMCGYSSNFKMDIAAMISEDTMIELTSIISKTVISKSTFFPWSGSYIFSPITLNTNKFSKKNNHLPA